MSDFYRVACGDKVVWFDNERDATEYFRDRARDDEQDGLPWKDGFSLTEVVGKLNELESYNLRRVFKL